MRSLSSLSPLFSDKGAERARESVGAGDSSPEAKEEQELLRVIGIGVEGGAGEAGSSARVAVVEALRVTGDSGVGGAV